MSASMSSASASHLYVVIMAGGAGTRFWPLSRRERPKQVLPLAGDGTTPLITATARRVLPLVPPERILVVTSRALEEVTRALLPELPHENVLLEPAARNTAPCVAWATAWVRRRDPLAVVCVLASDAYIADDNAFRDALTRAAIAAREGAIVTLGIEPARPETGYGYLHVGPETAPGTGAFHVKAFVEKPDAGRAALYVKTGQYLWNAGIFVYRADVMAEAFAKHIPEIAAGIHEIEVSAQRGHAEEEATLARVFPTLPSVSVDHGIMEKVSQVLVVPCDCGWSDVGSWQAAWELGDKDAAENVVRSDTVHTVMQHAHGNLVFAPPGKAVAVLGVDDLVVVDTADALLIIPRSRAQDVKSVVEEFLRRGDRRML